MLMFEIDGSGVCAGIAIYALYRFAAIIPVSGVRKQGKKREDVAQEHTNHFDDESAAVGFGQLEEPGAEPQPENAVALPENAEDRAPPSNVPQPGPAVARFRYKLIAILAFVVVPCVAILLCTPLSLAPSNADTSDTVVHVEATSFAPAPLGRAVAAPSNTRPPVSIRLQRQRMAIAMGTDVLYYKIAYYGTLNIGTPSVSYTFVFDTGSGHLILPSTYCNSESCKAHKRYRRRGSSSAIDVDHDGTPVGPNDARDQLTVQFGTGEVTGVFVDELVCMEEHSVQRSAQADIGGPSDTELPPAGSNDLAPGCMRMRIIAATDMSTEPFKTFAFDGVLGLGLSSLSRTPEFNFMNMVGGALRNVGAEMSHTFALFLGEKHEDSEILLGGWSDQHILGDLYWNRVHQPEHGHWMVEVKSIRVGDKVLKYCEEGCKAVVDSGTSLISVPTETFPELYEDLRHAAPVDGLCKGQGPQFHFELEHFTITMEPEDYARPEWYRKKSSWVDFGSTGTVDIEEGTFGKMRSDMYCRPMLMTMDIPEPVGPKLFILGEPVLRKYYTVYDTKDKRIGMGRARHECSSMPCNDDQQESDYEDEDDSWFADDDYEQKE